MMILFIESKCQVEWAVERCGERRDAAEEGQSGRGVVCVSGLLSPVPQDSDCATDAIFLLTSCPASARHHRRLKTRSLSHCQTGLELALCRWGQL